MHSSTLKYPLKEVSLYASNTVLNAKEKTDASIWNFARVVNVKDL